MTSPEAAPASLPPETQRTILLLSSAAFFSGAALRVCDSLLPRLAADFDLTAGAAGQVIIFFSVAYGLMQLVFGPLGDRYGKARMVCIAICCCTAGALACAVAPSFDALLATRVLWGMAAAGVIPLSIAWIGDAVPYAQRQATLARLLTGVLAGMMGGQLTGGLFADAQAGWRGAFLTLAAGYAVVAVLLLARVRHMPAPVAPEGARAGFAAQLLSVLRVPWARVVLAAVLAESVFLLGPMAYLPAYLHGRHGLSLSAASALIALYAVGGLLYAMSARRIVQRLGERRMVLWGGWVMGAGYLAWWLAPAGWVAGPVALAVGFGTYLFHNTLQTHATQMAPAVRGTAVALFAFSLFGGQALGVSLAGYAFDHLGPAPLLLVPAAALPLAGAWFARALARRTA
ncbi:MFS transporter [uncultured Ramlibacter sp.]|uniref:MFS transporter n=1 Tax=uncultured Ramlibacter sp. TaxID=260755 RepID=UPI002638306D|nr:MFS transporter [uncultured Ramlibacter sp.]